MRSRFSAYRTGQVDYIIHSTHGQSRHYQRDAELWKADLTTYCEQTLFVGLKIQSSGADFVVFEATLLQNKQTVVLREHSLFRKEDGVWKYLHEA